jgi:hypothetical protein
MATSQLEALLLAGSAAELSIDCPSRCCIAGMVRRAAAVIIAESLERPEE